MRFKSFLLICAVSLLSACAAPPFPNGPMCSMIWNESLEKSYAYCVETDTTGVPVRVPAEQVFKGKYVGVDPEYFGKIMTWKSDMEEYAKLHCN